jgi:NADP-dependent 3-hydroxy acid dehydrogenase YdfG
VTDLASVQAFVAAARERYGRIDVLVNNAGVMPLSLVEELRVDEWNRMIDVNLRGVLHGIAAVLPIMREQAAATSSTWRRSRRTGSIRPPRSIARPSSPSARCRKGCARRAGTCA